MALIFDHLPACIHIIVAKYCQYDELFRLMMVKEFRDFYQSLEKSKYGRELKQECIDILIDKFIKPYKVKIRPAIMYNYFVNPVDVISSAATATNSITCTSTTSDAAILATNFNSSANPTNLTTNLTGAPNTNFTFTGAPNTGFIDSSTTSVTLNKDSKESKDNKGRKESKDNKGRKENKSDNNKNNITDYKLHYVYISYICKDHIHMPHTSFLQSMQLLLDKELDWQIYNRLPPPFSPSFPSKWTIVPYHFRRADWVKMSYIDTIEYQSDDRVYNYYSIDTFSDLRMGVMMSIEYETSNDNNKVQNICGVGISINSQCETYIIGRWTYFLQLPSKEWITEEARRFYIDGDLNWDIIPISKKNVERMISSKMMPATRQLDLKYNLGMNNQNSIIDESFDILDFFLVIAYERTTDGIKPRWR